MVIVTYAIKNLPKSQYFHCSRLVENVQVRRAGFAYRQKYEQFVQRYEILCDKTWPNWHGTPKDGAAHIIPAMGIELDSEKIGRDTQKFFLDTPRTVSLNQ